MSTAPNNLSLWKTIEVDHAVLDAAGRGWLSILSTFVSRAGFNAVVTFRFAAALHYKGRLGKVCASVLRRMNIIFNSCDIDPRAQIGPGLKLSHPMGIVIGFARIGSNVMILQNVTVGMRRFSDDESLMENYPRVEDDVIICSGAALLGNITVGNGAIIGANAVVLSEVADKGVATGVPASVKSNP